MDYCPILSKEFMRALLPKSVLSSLEIMGKSCSKGRISNSTRQKINENMTLSENIY